MVWYKTQSTEMKLREKVILISFLGTQTPNKPINTNENYWNLIGQKGEVIETRKERVLVHFDCEIDFYQLENHNPVKNSLWILITDLGKIS